MSTYREHHAIDLENPTVSMAYLGDPVEDVIAMATADKWVVSRLGDGHSLGVRTMEVKPYDELFVRSRNGRVIAIGSSAWYQQPQEA